MAHLETDATGKQSGFQLLGILLLLQDNTTKLVRPRARFNSRIHGLKCTKARRSGTFLGLVDRGGGSCVVYSRPYISGKTFLNNSRSLTTRPRLSARPQAARRRYKNVHLPTRPYLWPYPYKTEKQTDIALSAAFSISARTSAHSVHARSSGLTRATASRLSY